MTSSDGYISILSFMEGELGDVYETPTVKIVETSVTVSELNNSTAAEAVKPSDIPPPAAALEECNQPETIVVANTLIGRKKPATATKSDVNSEKKKVTFGDPLDDRSIDKKRSPGDTVDPLCEPQAVSINILVAKKKKKMNNSSTPVATM